MKTLAIDTSQPEASVALAIDTDVIATRDFGAPSSHLVELGRVVDDVLGGAGVAVGELDRVALVSGPGSFTGLRVGFAWAKGLYAGLGTAIVTMTGLELMAMEAVDDARRVCPMMYARRDEVYTAAYVSAGRGLDDVVRVRTVVEPVAGPPQKILTSLDNHPTVFVGNVIGRYRRPIRDAMGGAAVFDTRVTRPSTEILARVARELDALDEEAVLALEPFYVRPSDAGLARLTNIRTHD